MKTNKKHTIDRPELNSDQINSMKDFDQVMKGAQGGGANLFTSKLILAGVVVLALVGLSTWYFLKDNDKQQVQVEQNKPEMTMPRTQEDPEETVRRPLVVPPVNEWDIPFQTYTLDAEKGGIINHSSGTQIQVPEQCLLDASGNPVTGEVVFKYREMHKAIEFALSGIPMTYDSAGTNYYFESAGMCELRAYQDGKVLEMHPDKPVSVNMKTTKTGVYNLYQLDEKQGNWVAKGATREQDNAKPSVRETLIEPISPLEAASSNKEVPLEIAQVQNEIRQIKKTKPVEPQKPDEGRPQIKLEIIPEEFPELAGFTNVKFEVAKEDKTFKPEFFDVVWNDIKLERYGEGKFQMVLSKGNGESSETVKLIVYPVFEGAKYTTAKAQYDKMLKEYTSKLNDRLAREKALKAELEQEAADARKAFQEQQERIRARQQAAYQASVDQANAYRANSDLTRAFQMKGFGIWNCDNPKMRGRRSVQAQYTLNEKVNQYTVIQLINDNAMLTNNAYLGKGTIRYHKRDENRLLCLLPNKKVAYNFSENWESGSGKGEVALTLSERTFANSTEVINFVESLKP